MRDDKKFYQTKEWKKASRSYTEDKTCEWCGRKSGDIVTVGDRKIKISLVPHHREKAKFGLRVYKRLATVYFKEYFKKGAHSDEYTALWIEAKTSLIPGAEDKDIRKRLRFLWDQKHRGELDEIYGRYKEEKKREYMLLSPDTAIILCNRCHYAREKGLILCKICNLNYHKPQYPTCYNCSGRKSK